MAEENSILTRLGLQVEAEGHQRGTPEFDRRLRQVKVEKCREMRGQYTCSDCPVFDFCDLAKHALRDFRGIK